MIKGLMGHTSPQGIAVVVAASARPLRDGKSLSRAVGSGARAYRSDLELVELFTVPRERFGARNGTRRIARRVGGALGVT